VGRHYPRWIIERLIGSYPGGYVVGVELLPRIASFEYASIARPISWILPAFDTPSVDVWSEGPAGGTWLPNPQSVEIGNWLGKGDLGIGVGRMPQRQQCFLRIDQPGVGSRENLRLCVVEFIESRAFGGT